MISHNHYDHLDNKTLLKIKNKKYITVICPLKLSKAIYNLGYKNVIELDWHERKKILDFEIFAMPAYHWSRRLGQKYNSSLWNGYIINFYNNKGTKEISINLDHAEIQEENVVKFELSNLIPPFDIFESPDGRKLGVLLESLSIQK